MGPVDSVKIHLSVVLGKSTLPINQLLRMGRGAVIELDSTEDDDVEILANNIPIARGEVSIQHDRIAVTVQEMLRSTKRRPHRQAVEDAPEPDAAPSEDMSVATDEESAGPEETAAAPDNDSAALEDD